MRNQSSRIVLSETQRIALVEAVWMGFREAKVQLENLPAKRDPTQEKRYNALMSRLLLFRQAMRGLTHPEQVVTTGGKAPLTGKGAKAQEVLRM